jgi:transcription-repair coupling factor (superfamily II helicase)
MAGLSQLHQLRGRVGRGSERAYAYFLYPPERALTETAHERLATVAQHTEVGAGMYVALKDLEIRGAGNLLGGGQSGHIAGVGFDLYVRMIGEAVNELKGDGPAEKPVAGQHIRFAPVELPDSRAGQGATAVPEDGAEVGGACHAGTGAEDPPRRPVAKRYCSRREATTGS